MANIHEIMDINNRSSVKGRSKKELSRMTHERSANGGHVFTHHFSSMGQYHEPETHTFGDGEGKDALMHFAKHAGLEKHVAEMAKPKSKVTGDEDDDNEAGESAEHEARHTQKGTVR